MSERTTIFLNDAEARQKAMQHRQEDDIHAYVLYTDYAKLEAENKALADKVLSLCSEIGGLKAECAALQSKVDTLMSEKHKAVWDAEKIALREAMKKYGDCLQTCAVWTTYDDCNCGLDDALSGAIKHD